MSYAICACKSMSGAMSTGAPGEGTCNKRDLRGTTFISSNQYQRRVTSMCGDDPRVDTKYATSPPHLCSKTELTAATSSKNVHAVALPDKVPSTSSNPTTSTEIKRTVSHYIGSKGPHFSFTPDLTRASCRVPDPGAGIDPCK